MVWVVVVLKTPQIPIGDGNTVTHTTVRKLPGLKTPQIPIGGWNTYCVPPLYVPFCALPERNGSPGSKT